MLFGPAVTLAGDYVYADASGAVVIPASSLERVLEEAVRLKREDAAFLEAIRSEGPAEIRRRGSEES